MLVIIVIIIVDENIEVLLVYGFIKTNNLSLVQNLYICIRSTPYTQLLLLDVLLDVLRAGETGLRRRQDCPNSAA
jgi:hypothetical protein